MPLRLNDLKKPPSPTEDVSMETLYPETLSEFKSSERRYEKYRVQNGEKLEIQDNIPIDLISILFSATLNYYKAVP